MEQVDDTSVSWNGVYFSIHTYITFISPLIYKSSCIANLSEKKKEINKIHMILIWLVPKLYL